MNLVVLRGFLVDGKTDAAVAMFKNGVKVYALARPANPLATEFILQEPIQDDPR